MPFRFIKTPIEGLLVIEPRKFPDGRGFFMETYKKSEFVKGGITEEFVQDNHSSSSKGVLRGLHFQKAPDAQGKLVRVIRGAVWDVGVDLRPESPTYGQWYGMELTEENGKMFYIPPGFAHGFFTLAEDNHFTYKCTAEYSPRADGGIRWDDPDVAIKWPVPEGSGPIISDKDVKLPFLKDLS